MIGSNDTKLAAPRDASWYRNPGRGGKYHVQAGTWHGYRISRCGVLKLNDELLIDAARVPRVMRCKRRGCREAWPAE